jgi:hypothetical protein
MFDPGSTLTKIEAFAFLACVSLRSICIPSSVRVLCKEWLSYCERLLSLTFESGSKLTHIEVKVFYGCSALKSICIPRSLQVFHGSAFLHSGIVHIANENGQSKLQFLQFDILRLMQNSH